MGHLDIEWEEVGHNAYRCPKCDEPIHQDRVFRHFSAEHTPSARHLFGSETNSKEDDSV